MSLFQLTYRSVSRINVGLLTELTDILETSNAKNRVSGITGALIYANRCFLQILEGQGSDVFSLYRAICRDPRHTKVTLVAFRPISDRFFGGWSMAIATQTLKTAPAFLPYLHEGRFDPETMSFLDIRTLMTEVANVHSYTHTMDWPAIL